MEFIDKYIGHMYGPYFLIFYLIVIVLFYFISKYLHLLTDNSSAQEAPQVPLEPDPYLIAYIRKGSKEAIKVILFSLLERRYLLVSSGRNSVMKNKKHPPQENLKEIEVAVFNELKKSTKIGDLVENEKLNKSVENLCIKSSFLSENENLMISENKEKTFRVVRLIFVFFIILIGLYKCSMAISNGHNNVLFLLVLGAAGSFIIYRIKFSSESSKRGKQFIKDLETIYYSKYEQGINKVSPYYQLLLASIFGFHLLHDKGYDFIEKYETKKATWSNSWGSCGSGCSSSCGGGCGGGCGGCS